MTKGQIPAAEEDLVIRLKAPGQWTVDSLVTGFVICSLQGQDHSDALKRGT